MTEPASAAAAELSRPVSARAVARLAAGAERLAERLARRAAALPTELDGDPDTGKLLAPWAQAFARGDREALARRLSWDGLDPSTAAAALADEGGPGTTPDWLAKLLRWNVLGRDLRQPLSDFGRELPFGELWEPWLALAGRELQRAAPTAAGLPTPALEKLQRRLGEDLARVGALAAHVAYLDFRSAEPAAPAPGAYGRFVAATLGAGLLSFYESFPVLLRQTWTLITSWRDSLAELLARLAADRPELEICFGRGRPLGALVRLERTESDRHAGGRGVFRVGFAGGVELAYKPRDLGIEAVWAALLGHAAAGLADVPPALAVLERDGYGWMEWAAPAELATDAEATRWFRRAGALIAFAELAGGQDLHAENVVATAAGPAIVDAEMLLQPRRAGADPRRDGSFAAGLLPRPGARDREAAWAGLLPVVARELGPARGWRGLGGDAIEPVAEPAHSRPLANVPSRDGRLLSPRDHPGDLAAGYAAAWRYLRRERAAWLAVGGPLARCAAARVRLLFRPSQDYATVLDLLTRPRYQRDGAAGGLLLEGLLRPFAEHAHRPLLWPLVAAERDALEAGDVPRFEVGADATVVVPPPEPGGEEDAAPPIEGYLVRSGLAEAQRRLAELDEAAIVRRCAELEDAISSVSNNEEEGTTTRASIEGLVSTGAAADSVAVAARALGDRLVAEEVGAVAAAAARGLAAAPAGDLLRALSLYDGRLGVLVALAEIDELDDGDRTESLFFPSMEAVDRLIVMLEREPASGLDLLPVGLSGLGGLMWSLVRLWDGGRRPAALAAARALVLRIDSRRLAGDSALDIESGAAGAVLGLLATAAAARAVGGDEDAATLALQLAGVAGARLLAGQGADGGWAPESGPALAGFAHGAAGIVRALDALAGATGDERYRDAARRGIAFERALFDPERGNWPVLQADPRLGEVRRTWMVAWCHGAPGIALGRALAAGLADERTRAELERAAATTAVAPAASHDHLCCGTAGRVAVLDALGRRYRRPDARAAAAAGARALAARLAAGPQPPAGTAAALRSLFRGTAGVAWALARVAGPARALDVLALELPHEDRAGAAPENR